MITRSAFHLDCTGVIPECEFKCEQCLKEIHSVLGEIQGVNKSYLDDEPEESKIIVEHDSSKVSVEHLMETFRGLPSFYKGFFVPEMLESEKLNSAD